MDTSVLQQELAPLNAQIDETWDRLRVLEDELQSVAAELETFADERQRIDALREVCDALDRLGELDAGELFWDGLPTAGEAPGYVARLRERVAGFEDKTRQVRQRQEDLQARIDRHLDELDALHLEVSDAYAREERRRDEFVIEREISPLPFRQMVMPWTREGESERRFRKAMLVALFWSALLGSLIPLVNVPIPDRAHEVVEIPERLAMLVKKEPPPPAPVPERPREEAKPEPETPEKPQKTKKAAEPETAPKAKKKPKAAPAGGDTRMARKKAESTGVLKFKSDFKDLMDEVPVAKLGTEARLNKKAPKAAGAARAKRSLVATEAGSGASNGIENFGVSRNLGSGGSGSGGHGTADRIGGVGFSRVESAVAGLEQEARPLSDGPGPGRTDEEIQIVFDRYKAALYRIYNKELRRNPTLRGEMLLRLTIEPDGTVSLCKVESTDLDSQHLVDKIVARVERFNFGPKKDVPPTTILYPIDFLPAS